MGVIKQQLPSMPGEYIAREVHDPHHSSIVVLRKSLEVLGGITYRAFENRKFIEITFTAVSADYQTQGYGAHLMNHLKDYIRTTSKVEHLLAYADNSAIRWFRKQGFTDEITLPEAVWWGVIKDYQDSTFMMCTMLEGIRYLEVPRMLHMQKLAVLAKIEATNHRSALIHQPPKQWASGTGPMKAFEAIDPMSIPAIAASGWSPFMDEQSRIPRHPPQYTQMKTFLTKLQSNKHAAPFLRPVDKALVPDYYDVIKDPMDLKTIEEKLENDVYKKPEEFMDDVKLIISNARKYNDQDTVHAAGNFSRYRIRLVKEISQWSYLLD